ncbi:MAG TPA: PRC-barrel domain-containing protein [Gemmatimonadaceae bacterium]|nr:PRC-barrel domain-containing protein [Gemmatimonadaceae bacterium]
MAKEKSRSTDQAGTGPDPRLSRHLMPLREAKRYRLAKGEADIRGWSVYTSSGQEVGRVGDLLVDPSMGEVVMFDVNRGDTGDQTIAPLRAAWIDRETKRVIIEAAYLAPAVAQSDVYTTTTTMRSPVPPPAQPTDDDLPRERMRERDARDRDARDLTRDERTVRSDEIVLDRQLADSGEPLPPEGEPTPPRGTPRVDRRDHDDYPDRPA